MLTVHLSRGLLVILSIAAITGSVAAQTFLLPQDNSRLAIAACSGEILDPGGSGNLVPQRFGAISVYPDRADAEVELEVLDLDLHANDELIVHGDARPYRLLGGRFHAPLAVGATFVGSHSRHGALSVSLNTGADPTPRRGVQMRIRCKPPSDILMGDARVHELTGKRFLDSGGAAAPYGPLETLASSLWGPQFLELTFSTVDVESCCDEVSIRTPTGSLLGSVPGVDSVFHSVRGFKTEFSSDGSIQGAGWEATMRSANSVVDTFGSLSALSPETTIVDRGGFENQYPPSSTVTYSFSQNAGGADLGLAFERLELGAGDTLNVYGGSSTSSPLLASLNSSSLVPDLLTQPGSDTLTLQRTSDATDEGDFRAVTQEIVTAYTNRTVTTCSALVLDSGGRGGNYSSNEDIVVTLHPDNPAAHMQLRFLSFDLESFDRLRVHDGASIAAPLIGEFTGTDLPATQVASPVPGGSLTLRFISDSTVVRPGFTATASCALPLFADGFEGGNTSRWSAAVP